jgi:hypothetical protein
MREPKAFAGAGAAPAALGLVGVAAVLLGLWSERIMVAGFLLAALFLCAQILARRARDPRRPSDAARPLRPRAGMDVQALGHLLLLLALLFAAILALLWVFIARHDLSWTVRLPPPARLGALGLLTGLVGLVPNAAARWVPISCPSKDCRGRAYLKGLRPVLYQCRKCGAAHAMSLGLGRG